MRERDSESAQEGKSKRNLNLREPQSRGKTKNRSQDKNHIFCFEFGGLGIRSEKSC